MARTESKLRQLTLKGTGDEYQALYCSLCDVYVYSKNLLRQHMENSPRHPRCNLCKRSYLNLNSLRCHYLWSNRHHYCATCDRSFDSPLALKIHNDHATFHRDERNEDEDTLYVEERRHKGWENKAAADLERRENTEEAVVIDESEALSQFQVGKKMLELKHRMRTQQQETSQVLKQTCPICLYIPKKICVTRCGHTFCSSCIHHAFEQGQGCPSCRKLGATSQLRKIDLSVC
ncbi:hypothetical protein J3R30DRAFT_3294496 [Lentinula aciculospora]|uniref:RING-type domain-containing protein n=1 Tax=Lentinula aciculospora TaxID=153920 RepID=A0A9W9DL44_9AGAR|nr:hypothetical protein J3R30DRAFT_3294496 [Lentinula aciculospora]